MFYAMFALIILSFNLVKVDYDLEDFAKLYFLEGEWSMPFKEGVLVEKWKKKYNKAMNGETIYFKGDEKLSQDNISLTLRDGRIYYVPKLNNKNNEDPVEFTLSEIDKNKFIFENKQHTFPQKITYEIKSPDEFLAVIEGETNKGFKQFKYNFKRKLD